MKILALETSQRQASVAVAQGQQIQGEATLGDNLMRDLAPTIARLVRQAGWEMQQLDLIAAAQGPGGFTGLRVGVTTAKTLAYALDCPVLGVDSMEVVAEQARDRLGSGGELEVVIDAQRGQLCRARYRLAPQGTPPLQLGDPTLMDWEAWLAETGTLPASGSGLERVRRLMAGKQQQPQDQRPRQHAPENHWLPEQDWIGRAVTVVRLAQWAYHQGIRHDPWNLLPRYYRPSAAEEKARDSQSSGTSSGGLADT